MEVLSRRNYRLQLSSSTAYRSLLTTHYTYYCSKCSDWEWHQDVKQHRLTLTLTLTLTSGTRMLSSIGSDLSSDTTRMRRPWIRLIVRSGRSTRKTRSVRKAPG